ncbi:MAG: aminotransferase class I/II-fold pyridoxal phosphate-dependent enzyme [Acidobacteria bacterium]|nr:aminotransferase class I/II-fold pyridoxal phosphate-dependent enzyme [Acidobacteriota bacterium]
MRAAMAAAPVGDDQFGEDPTTNDLQARVASMLGKEAALWMPSGTMANQVALQLLTAPGDDVIVGSGAHAVWSEAGASAANAGVQFTEIGHSGTFTPDEFTAALKPRGHVIMPGSSLVEIENTHNRGGGVVWAQGDVEQVCAMARAQHVATFLDGARLWNAAVASGLSLSILARPFDVVSVAFSKGLGAPGGSMLAGSSALMTRALRVRRRFGGAMRQTGIYAAAALHGLDHHMDRLAEDHAHARLIAERLSGVAGVQLDLSTVQTNIVIFHLAPGAPDAATVVERARSREVLVIAFGPRTVRVVTHLDVSRDACVQAAEVLASVVEAA